SCGRFTRVQRESSSEASAPPSTSPRRNDQFPLIRTGSPKPGWAFSFCSPIDNNTIHAMVRKCTGFIYKHSVKRDNLFYNKHVTGIIHLERAGYPDVPTIRGYAVAVRSHEQFPLEGAEQHPMTIIRRGNGSFLMDPGTIQCTASGISYSLGIRIKDPAGPQHPQPTGLGAEQERAVSHLVRHHLSVLIPFLAPR